MFGRNKADSKYLPSRECITCKRVECGRYSESRVLKEVYIDRYKKPDNDFDDARVARIYSECIPYIADEFEKSDIGIYLENEQTVLVAIDTICTTLKMFNYDAEWIDDRFRPYLEKRWLHIDKSFK